MELGEPTTQQRAERGRLDVVLDTFDEVFVELLEIVETGGLDQLTANQKLEVWQRFETSCNRLPLIDHSLIADAEATDLAGSYCSSTLTRFLVQVLQLSPGEAASRVRAAAAVGPRKSMLGEQLEPLLPKLRRCRLWNRAMHKLSRPGLHRDDVDTAEQLLTQYAPVLGPVELRRYALQVVNAADPDGPEPIDDQRQHDRRHLELKQRGMACGTCRANSPTLWVPNSTPSSTHSPSRAPPRWKTRTAPPRRSRMSGPTGNGSTTP
jgi:hypothetical protein